jgi:alkylation response protein AidB-like acyl-CoA dehydrogenase
MDLTFSESEDAFRAELREWLAANEPGPEPDGGEDEQFAWRRDFQRRLHQGRWAGIEWPREYGGRGGTLAESAILYEELGHAGAPLPANVLGLLLAGPTIISWGEESQKERFLDPILSAEQIWCQGFSEPDAGSDLAALKTRARRDGDGEAPRKHQGLTYFLLDMEQPGVTVAPLCQITGESEFNEVFLDEARVPDENVLGGVGNGWKVALTTLMNERAGLAFFFQVRLRKMLDQLVAEADERGLLADPSVAATLGDLHVRAETLRLLGWKGLGAIERHGQPGPEGSLTKWLWSETNQLLTQAAVDIVGADALVAGPPSSWGFELLRARGNTIEGGTTEILKNIVAERVLGLPKGR